MIYEKWYKSSINLSKVFEKKAFRGPLQKLTMEKPSFEAAMVRRSSLEMKP